MKYISVCSGIEAATVAWEPLGFKAIAFSEINPFCCELLEQKYPQTPNLGDMNEYQRWQKTEQPDILVGGTPCQSFSIAGLRRGIEDPRGNLSLVFSRIAEKYKPKYILWENVPGVLSSNGGRDFGSFIGSLVEFGYHVSWRILNAQYFGVPQRRRRVFLIGYSGERGGSEKILLESESLSGIPEKRCKRETIAIKVKRSNDCPFCGSENSLDPKKNGCTSCSAWVKNPINCISDGAHMGGGINGQDYNSGRIIVQPDGKVRRLTPLEIERIMGFPDDYTKINNSKDGNRFKAISNSMCVPVMKWIGKRIMMHNKGLL